MQMYVLSANQSLTLNPDGRPAGALKLGGAGINVILAKCCYLVLSERIFPASLKRS